MVGMEKNLEIMYLLMNIQNIIMYLTHNFLTLFFKQDISAALQKDEAFEYLLNNSWKL